MWHWELTNMTYEKCYFHCLYIKQIVPEITNILMNISHYIITPFHAIKELYIKMAFYTASKSHLLMFYRV